VRVKRSPSVSSFAAGSMMSSSEGSSFSMRNGTPPAGAGACAAASDMPAMAARRTARTNRVIGDLE
jgi:hypothetical protein